MNQNGNTFIQNNSNNESSLNNVSNNVINSPTNIGVQQEIGDQKQIDPIFEKTSVSSNPNIIICPKCGSEMKKDSRYCMKCGNLNYAHPDNESMKQYAWQNIKQGHFISGANVDNKQPLSMGNVKSVSNVNPFRSCLITNIILHLLAFVALFLFLNNFNGANNVILIVFFAISILVGFIFNYSVQAMFIKAGERWWGYFIPFYNTYIMYKIGYGNGWVFLTLFIPIVGLIFNLTNSYKVGKNFYKNGWLTLFFPFIMIPVIAFDKNAEYSLLARKETANSTFTVNNKGKTDSERRYGRKKFFSTLIVVILLSVALYFGWPYIEPWVKTILEFVLEQIKYFN